MSARNFLWNGEIAREASAWMEAATWWKLLQAVREEQPNGMEGLSDVTVPQCHSAKVAVSLSCEFLQVLVWKRSGVMVVAEMRYRYCHLLRNLEDRKCRLLLQSCLWYSWPIMVKGAASWRSLVVAPKTKVTSPEPHKVGHVARGWILCFPQIRTKLLDRAVKPPFKPFRQGMWPSR
jgi:hypothetical protein